jgi:hypothetical protein
MLSKAMELMMVATTAFVQFIMSNVFSNDFILPHLKVSLREIRERIE